jgi:diguanylate cyclase (GGDEF)-like protein
MDTTPFVEALHELNNGFVKLLDSISALKELSSLRISGQSKSQLLNNALAVLMHNQDLERCSIFLLEEGKLVNRAGMEWNEMIGVEAEREHKPIVFGLGEGAVGLAAQKGLLQHCRDCRTDKRFLAACKQCSENLMTNAGSENNSLGSLISVPIQHDGEMLGVLNVSHPHVGFFNEGHERTLMIFCNFLGQLLVNNRLLSQMDHLVGERTEQLERALMEAEALKQRYEQLSVIDELTLLHNRRFFFPEARSALSQAMRYKRPFSVLLLDIDHFKRINDELGHAIGDEVLRQVAAVFQSVLRESDILARFGGEEFVIAAPETDATGMLAFAERLRAAVNGMESPSDGPHLKISVSIGIATLDGQPEVGAERLLDELLKEADQALYFGKQNGRDQCRAYSDIACFL